MKKTLLFILIAFQIQGFAQDVEPSTSTSNYNRQIGIDATSLLTLFVNSNGSFNNNLYFLNFKKASKKGNFRFGFGGDFEIEERNSGTNSDFGFNLRFGEERYVDFGKQWRAYYGWDFRTNLSFISFGSNDNSQTQIALGAAPVIGLQFRINSRLSVSTEAAYNAFFIIKDASGDTNLSALTFFSTPSFLYFNFDF